MLSPLRYRTVLSRYSIVKKCQKTTQPEPVARRARGSPRHLLPEFIVPRVSSSLSGGEIVGGRAGAAGLCTPSSKERSLGAPLSAASLRSSGREDTSEVGRPELRVSPLRPPVEMTHLWGVKGAG